MNGLLTTLRDILFLNTSAYEQWREAPQAMKRGFLLLIICALLAGSLNFIMTFRSNLRPFTQDQANQIEEEFMQGMQVWQAGVNQQDPAMQVFMDQFITNFRAGINIGVEIDALPSPLPRGLARLLQSLGGWITRGFGQVSLWLGYGIWVLLFARLLGGQGRMDRFFGTTALYAVPNLLGLFNPVPAVGPLMAFIGTLWGILVYGKAVQVSQQLTTGRTIAAMLLPLALAFVLAIVLSMIFFVPLAISASAGQG